MLAPGKGKTKTARLWTYVRDDRPAGYQTAPAVWFAYSQDRKGEHPRQHLKDFRGALQADAYSGFHHLYGAGAIYEVACWAHARRKFYDVHLAHSSPTTTKRCCASERCTESRKRFAASRPSIAAQYAGACPATAGQSQALDGEGAALPVHQERRQPPSAMRFPIGVL